MIEPGAQTSGGLPISPQLAWRVAVLGGVALVLFAIVFFRLWYLQILSGDQYRRQANANRVRDIPIPAPRGEILDRNGVALVTDRTTYAVQISPDRLPRNAALRREVYRRLARVLDMHTGALEQIVATKAKVQPPYADVTVKVDAGYGALTYLQEHQLDFPGVSETRLSLRDYPFHDLAAQILGYVGQVNATELKAGDYRGAKLGTIVGQSGLEASYDGYLRGTDGTQRVEVNSMGQYEGTLSPTQPIAGHDLKLTIDYGLQAEGDRALQQGMALGRANGNSANAGAFVAMDPRDGSILAIGSYPSFDPNELARPFTEAQYKALQGSSSAPGPMFDRAIMGQYPTGSTFKPITAMAGLEGGYITPATALGAGSCVTIGLQSFCNAGHTDYGALDLQNALRVSEDTYFYQLGAMTNPTGHQEGAVQTMAHTLGLGHGTGVDLPGEAPGNVPTIAWRAHQNQVEQHCERVRHVSSCHITDGNPWTIGDNVQLATGQGDLLATPLQMATMYSTLANVFMHGNGHGIVPVPHLAQEVDDSSGRVVQQIQPPAARHVTLNPADLDVVMAGLHDAAMAPGGTSTDVWTGFGHTVYGKTGTAQHTGQDDQSWYVCYLPDPARPIVIAVTIEKGGFGAQAAAPAARLMAAEWFHEAEKVVRGNSRTL